MQHEKATKKAIKTKALRPARPLKLEGQPGPALQTLLDKVAKGEIAEDAIITPKVKPSKAKPKGRASWTPERIKQKVAEELLTYSLGELLEQARLAKGVSAAQHATRLRVTRSQIYQNERPDANLELATLLRHAEALGYSVEVVLTSKRGDAGRLVAVL
jgi:ribosome-binding protein aMBF1 (putative translation factor)